MKRIAAFLLISVMAISACSSSSGSGLTGKAWQWQASADPALPMPGVVPDPGSYTATFNTDGSINVKADCNNVNGTYKQTGSSLTISFGVTTLAACPSGSLDSIFLAGLEKAASYAIANDALTITLSDTGTMSFK